MRINFVLSIIYCYYSKFVLTVKRIGCFNQYMVIQVAYKVTVFIATILSD